LIQSVAVLQTDRAVTPGPNVDYVEPGGETKAIAVP
jgi:hypothetical protein